MRRTVPLNRWRFVGAISSLAAVFSLVVAPVARAQSRGSSGMRVDVAILPLVPLGATPQDAAQALRLLTQALRTLPEVQLFDPARVAAAKRRPEFARCEDVACLTRIGRSLGVLRVVGGDIGSLGGSFAANLRLIDVTAGTEARQVTAPLELGGQDGANERSARAALVRLLAPQRYTGDLQVDVDVAGATVYLDGRPVAMSPAPRVRGIPVGNHALRIAKEEYRDFLAFVQVDYDKVAQVRAPLSAYPVVSEEVLARRKAKEGSAWYRQWWVLVVLGVVVASGAAIGIATANHISADHTAQIR